MNTCFTGLTVDSVLSADSNFGTHDTHDRSTYTNKHTADSKRNGEFAQHHNTLSLELCISDKPAPSLVCARREGGWLITGKQANARAR